VGVLEAPAFDKEGLPVGDGVATATLRLTEWLADALLVEDATDGVVVPETLALAQGLALGLPDVLWLEAVTDAVLGAEREGEGDAEGLREALGLPEAVLAPLKDAPSALEGVTLVVLDTLREAVARAEDTVPRAVAQALDVVLSLPEIEGAREALPEGLPPPMETEARALPQLDVEGLPLTDRVQPRADALPDGEGVFDALGYRCVCVRDSVPPPREPLVQGLLLVEEVDDGVTEGLPEGTSETLALIEVVLLPDKEEEAAGLNEADGERLTDVVALLQGEEEAHTVAVAEPLLDLTPVTLRWGQTVAVDEELTVCVPVIVEEGQREGEAEEMEVELPPIPLLPLGTPLGEGNWEAHADAVEVPPEGLAVAARRMLALTLPQALNDGEREGLRVGLGECVGERVAARVSVVQPVELAVAETDEKKLLDAIADALSDGLKEMEGVTDAEPLGLGDPVKERVVLAHAVLECVTLCL